VRSPSGPLHFDLAGEKLAARFVLVRTDRDAAGKEQWLLLHKRDAHAVEGWDPEAHPRSVKSGRTNEEVAAAPDALWRSDQPAARAEVPLRPAVAAPTTDELAALDALGTNGTWVLQGRELTLTNLDKVLFPGRDGEPPVTKRELVRYYARVAPAMVPYLAGRPLNLHRYPDGVDRSGFWHKELPRRTRSTRPSSPRSARGRLPARRCRCPSPGTSSTIPSCGPTAGRSATCPAASRRWATRSPRSSAASNGSRRWSRGSGHLPPGRADRQGAGRRAAPGLAVDASVRCRARARPRETALGAPHDNDLEHGARTRTSRVPQWVAIFAVSLAGLLIEVAYTRIVSYKLWYYYTYMVIGLSLLGIGTGGVVVAVSKRLRRASTDGIVAGCAAWGAASVVVAYLVIARVPIDTIAIWDYGTRSSLKNLATLGLICFMVFATFIAIGIAVSILLGRAGDRVGRLYFADLAGAGLACFVAIPLIAWVGPPDLVLLSAAGLGLLGALAWPRLPITPALAAGAAVLACAVGVVASDRLPDVHTERGKIGGPGASYSEWGPVFRVDVAELAADSDTALLLHDGTFGSALHRWDGDVSALSRYDADPRSIPFAVLGAPPERELIIGSAGGNEILASLYYGAPRIEAVELNPVTVDLLRGRYADYTGRLVERPEVELHQGDGRSYLARTDARYDLVWYVAPDSYAANNAASSGAFVLSESYLYTSEMIQETLEHLTDDGIMVVQFGELDFERSPNRTSRYVVTARHALEAIGVDDPSQHLAVAAYLVDDSGDLSTIVVKRTPFTEREASAFADASTSLPNVAPIHVPGDTIDFGIVSRLAGATPGEVDALVAAYPRNISAVRDDAPFFWHFAPFDDVLANILDPIDVEDPEDVIGERVLLLLLLIAAVYAAVFLLLPFVAVRSEWRALPRKGVSAVYFAALGLGFMMFEITMIQRLVEFLGYPTRSLTVTLAAILVTAGVGSLLSARFAIRARTAVPVLVVGLAALAVVYRLGLDPLLDGLHSADLGFRVFTAVVVLTPLGLALGAFMPLGLGLLGHLTPHREEYIAWAWAVNGFFSVIGSVLTTILSMTYGFRQVQLLAVVVYAVGALAFRRLAREAPPPALAPPEAAVEPVPAAT
jgi:hypothetical protein